MANLKELARETANEAGYTIQATEEIVRIFWKRLESTLNKGQDVSIPRFGKFIPVQRKPKDVYCATRGNLIHVGNRKGVRFCESKALKARLNSKANG